MTEFLGTLRRLIGRTLFGVNILMALWLLLCLVAGYVSPLSVSYLGIFSLSAPFAVLANALFIFIWLWSKRKKRILLPLLTLLLCSGLIGKVFGWHYFSGQDWGKGEKRLKVMTWNVHGLGIYDRPRRPDVPDLIFDMVEEQDPDILCMIEFYADYRDALRPYAAKWKRNLGYREYRFVYDNTLGVKIYIGIALFSKYPIHNMKEVWLSRNVNMMQADVDVARGQTYRLFLFHLQSFMLGDADKAYIEEMKHRNGQVDGKLRHSRSFVGKFARAFYLRALQADSVAGMIRNSPYPAIVCGDMNDVPGSYAYNTMRGSLKDAFAARGSGLGRTYNLISPTLRIDYVFYDPGTFRPVAVSTPKSNLSDHNPVIVNFEIRDPRR